ncbi:MAG: hypothetical protein D6705_04465 [Deltaproteobacteria bacterium]|nr:MAG: hypothetical protein D6705_04465 [Deltaproteobacteria bacterium]
MRKGTLFAAVSAVSVALTPVPVHAFSTRVHVAIANAVRRAALDGGGRIALRASPYAVDLPEQDFAAIRDYPLAFRAGAIGPDNKVFPGMTDPSHAIGRRPYEQFEALYRAAATSEERAYALGCFLHGATDAVAHHFVNYFSGETFTLNPITSDRSFSLDNVVRHIVVESLIQRSLFEAAPEDFDQGSLLHAIPNGFLLRTYLDPSSEVWQMAAEEAFATFEDARAQAPDAPLPAVVAGLDIGPADHLLLAPIYLDEIDASVEEARATIEARIAELQDPGTPDGATLGVIPGADGVLGTKDDGTACAASCPDLYATYFVYVGLLAPRYDAMQNELPSAFDKIADKLRDDLAAFGPAYVQTVGNLSARLNAPLGGMEAAFDLEPWEVEVLAAPLFDWADGIATVDYDTLLVAILPDWVIEMQMLLQQVGVDVQLSGIVEAVFQPLLTPIEQAIREQFVEPATAFVMDLADAVASQQAQIEAEVRAVADAVAAEDLPGSYFDHLLASGLYTHAFDLTAVTLADHRMILPPDGLDGPASFDASFTPAWTQPGVCDYLREAVFPFGIDAAALFSVEIDGQRHPARAPAQSPIECHDGDLGAFTEAPSPAVCALVALEELLDAPVGSISRAYPPAVSPTSTACLGLAVPGLPAPPDEPGEGTGGGSTTAGEEGSTGAAAGSTSAGVGAAEAGGGCGCSARPGPKGTLGGVLGLLLAAASPRRRRRRRPDGRLRRTAAIAALVAPFAGCGGAAGPSGGASDGTTTSTGTASGTTASTVATDASASSGGSAGSSGPVSGTSGTTTGNDDGLLEALDGTKWHGVFVREGVERAYEIAFDSESMLWSEIRNPYGPARLREMRSFTRDEEGRFHTIVVSPGDGRSTPRTVGWTRGRSNSIRARRARSASPVTA